MGQFCSTDCNALTSLDLEAAGLGLGGEDSALLVYLKRVSADPRIRAIELDDYT